ncbi:hypothetical protein M6D93_16085 [Jatrophihabitans telluris]|uniref:Uncharacterized protein n=1 Tax=Jatrophihabitans telluris TaxID=2038343 RepID=A0ABY4QXE3_9ACTN|nr:hypothetical protein [Jatrophihabitans telluris]UQX87807.1 hypothetical protein M6D93_16085 [Jatrophihabitans telluris]
MPSFTEPIVAISLTSNAHQGVTLYAPPWEDTDGEQWQGFLGDGAKIVLLGTPDELSDWLQAHPDHDLADHPAWEAFAGKGKTALEPAESDHYDFDAVYELAAGDADPVVVSELGDTIDIAARVADCCEDGALRSLLGNTREYALLVEGETSYSGKEGAAEWTALGDVIADSWERAANRLNTWLRWEGSSTETIVESDDETD